LLLLLLGISIYCHFVLSIMVMQLGENILSRPSMCEIILIHTR